MNQRFHAAMMALREADDFLQLILLLVRLQRVGSAPTVYTQTYVLGKVHYRALVNPELFQGLVEDVLLHFCQLAHRLLALRLVRKGSENTIQQDNRRVVPAEKEVMRITVCIGVHENGAAGITIP